MRGRRYNEYSDFKEAANNSKFVPSKSVKKEMEKPKISDETLDEEPQKQKDLKMKNALVLIITCASYQNEKNNLYGARRDLNRWRDLFENKYHYMVYPERFAKDG
eukprot:233993_1